MDQGKQYSWLSFASSGLILLLIISFIFLPNVPMNTTSEFIINWVFIIAIPISIIISLIAVIKKNEKKLLGTLGLIFGTLITLIYCFSMFVEMGP